FVLVTFYALLFVFFSSSRDPLHLPSFPTRRSSDLGSGPGPYLILPFFEPMTVRDGIGKGVDGAMNPLSYVLPFFWAGIGMKAGDTVNDRALNLELFQGFEESVIDMYSAVRNAYLRRREQLIKE